MAADTPWVRTLLDETDTTLRARQHFSILGAIALLLAAVPMVGDPGLLKYGILTIAIAFVLFGYAATVDQRWDTEYKGHKVRYQNNPLRGEKLIVDGRRVARGKLGIRAEMRAPLEGSDEVIVAQSDARLTRLRCHIFVESPLARAAASAISDQELLAEVQRRGLRT